jgi:hypothetical protein
MELNVDIATFLETKMLGRYKKGNRMKRRTWAFI